jgi:hypothetical protein
VPTSCSPLKDYRSLANEIKSLKSDPDQILVAGIFGWPRSDADMATAQYKIDQVPNPNTADTAHPTMFDSWPICYDSGHMPANANTYDPAVAGWGATAGLRNAAFVDEFGANGLKFSICETDFTAAMTGIGNAIAKKQQNLCLTYKLVDTDVNTAGLQPDCRVVYRSPHPDPLDPTKVIYSETANPLPVCDPRYSPANPPPDSVGDCWQLAYDTNKCPATGQMIQVLRTASEIAAGPLAPGTKIGMNCRTCPDSTAGSAVVSVPGCDY